MPSWLVDIANPVGISGVFLILLSYLLLQIDWWRKESVSYSLINFIGSIAILISLLVHFNLASMIIEVVWILISFYGLTRSLIRREKLF